MPNIEASREPDIDANALKSGDGKFLHVLVGVIKDEQGRYLVAKREKHKHQGGLWEFAGGKREQGEDARTALDREIKEELGLEVLTASPFMQVRHQYPSVNILLDVWVINSFKGEAIGREGQDIAWFSYKELAELDFPDANQAILKALSLPKLITISPAKALGFSLVEKKLSELSLKGGGHLHYRAHSLSDHDYLHSLDFLIRAKMAEPNVKVFANRDYFLVQDLPIDGVHFTEARMRELEALPNHKTFLFSASCHGLDGLKKAEALGFDYAFLSPVQKTASHPDQKYLGWERAKALIEQVNIPVYCLGGMAVSDLSDAKRIGGIGVAGIRQFWGEE